MGDFRRNLCPKNDVLEGLWGEIFGFSSSVFRSLSTNPKVKELLKSVHICQS